MSIEKEIRRNDEGMIIDYDFLIHDRNDSEALLKSGDYLNEEDEDNILYNKMMAKTLGLKEEDYKDIWILSDVNEYVDNNCFNKLVEDFFDPERELTTEDQICESVNGNYHTYWYTFTNKYGDKIVIDYQEGGYVGYCFTNETYNKIINKYLNDKKENVIMSTERKIRRNNKGMIIGYDFLIRDLSENESLLKIKDYLDEEDEDDILYHKIMAKTLGLKEEDYKDIWDLCDVDECLDTNYFNKLVEDFLKPERNLTSDDKICENINGHYNTNWYTFINKYGDKIVIDYKEDGYPAYYFSNETYNKIVNKYLNEEEKIDMNNNDKVLIDKKVLKRLMQYPILFSQINAGDYGDDTEAYALLEYDIRAIEKALGEDYKTKERCKETISETEEKCYDIIFDRSFLSREEVEEIMKDMSLDEEDFKSWMENYDRNKKEEENYEPYGWEKPNEDVCCTFGCDELRESLYNENND